MKSEILRIIACSLIIVFGATTFTNVAQSNEAYGNLFERKKAQSLPVRRAAYIPRKAVKRVQRKSRKKVVVRSKRNRIYKRKRVYKRKTVVRKKRKIQRRKYRVAKTRKYRTRKYKVSKNKVRRYRKKAVIKRKAYVRKATFSPQKRLYRKRKSVSSRVSGRSRYSHLIEKHASTYGVPVKLAHAVVKIESNYRAGVRGGAGEIGLMQIKPATARLMGFRGSSRALYNPDTNLKYGMKYLAGAYKRSGGSVCGTVLRYNAGHGARRMNPISARYCRKAKRILRTNHISAPSRARSNFSFEEL